MLTKEGKRKVEYRFGVALQMADFFHVNTLPSYSPPQLGCVYAFEMSDGTVKIGVTSNPEKRIKSVQSAVYLDVLRVHQTGFAPLDFMRIIERRCQDAFIDSHVRGEYFRITFEEACLELDKHAEEIDATFRKADQNFLDEFIYFEELKAQHYAKINKPSPKPHPAAKRKTKSKRATEQLGDTRIFVLLMSNGDVKIGYSNNVCARVAEIQRETGLTVNDLYFSSYMSREVARLIERLCHEIFSSSKTDGEFFCVEFDMACKAVDAFVKFSDTLASMEPEKILVLSSKDNVKLIADRN